MFFKFDKSLITISNREYPSWQMGWKLQLYYPEIAIRSRYYKELFVSFPTVFRVNISEDYFGFGFQILGFGVGFDQLKDKIKLTEKKN